MAGCDHKGSTVIVSEDRSAGSTTYSCQRCGANWTVTRH